MNWPHAHLALNHFPVLGTAFVCVLLVTGWISANQFVIRLALAWFVLLTVISIPIKFTGDFAYESLAKAEWIDESYISAHEQSADQATTAMFVLGLISTAAWWRHRADGAISTRWFAAVFLGAVVTFLMMARTANLGGMLPHTEIRSAIEVSQTLRND